MFKLLLFLLGITVVYSILLEDGGKGKKRKHRFDDSSFSSSEESGRGHHHHHGRPSNGGSGQKPCPSDWITFDRPQGRWCAKVFISSKGITYLTAETQCRAMNATLTGLQNDDERLKLADSAKQAMLPFNYGQATTWLGARRKGSCPMANICFPKETFFWTDNFTTGIEGFGFSLGQPDGTHNQFGFESCVHQLVFASGTTHGRWPGIIHGQLNDLHCQDSSLAQMYACGRRP